MPGLDVVVWSDFLCPWCYLGQHRTALLRQAGATVTALPYELHPDIPDEGVAIRPGRFDRIAALCAEVGMPFVTPERLPNSRRLLATGELVRQQFPDAHAELERSLFAATFVDGRYLGDPDTVDELVAASGADAAAVREAVDAGAVDAAVAASVAAAHERGVSGTPAWLFNGSFLLPGVQDVELYGRIVAKLSSLE